MSLIEKAKEDERRREKEKREEEREHRAQMRGEIAAITEQAAVWVAEKLDEGVAPSALEHQEDTTPADEYLAWRATIDGMRFEITRRNQSRRFSLYHIPEGVDEDDYTEVLERRRYIRRLADLIKPDPLAEQEDGNG